MVKLLFGCMKSMLQFRGHYMSDFKHTWSDT